METITIEQGNGGINTSNLIKSVFKSLLNDILIKGEDGAVLTNGDGQIVTTTDSFIINPVVFKGGDIGKLAVCGTVNDCSMMGGVPKYMTAGFILLEGQSVEELKTIVHSMSNEIKKAKVKLTACDTKVLPSHDKGGGILINTSCIGFKKTVCPQNKGFKSGDEIIITGDIGDHETAIMSERLGVKNNIKSDCANLSPIVTALLKKNIKIRLMRDVTRGGLSTILNEIAQKHSLTIELNENQIPIKKEVKAFCNMFGLNPFTMANEGKMILIIEKNHSKKAIEVLQKFQASKKARIIGAIRKTKKPQVLLNNSLGNSIILRFLEGEGTPRIC